MTKHLTVEISDDLVQFVFLRDNIVVNHHQSEITGIHSSEKKTSLEKAFQSTSFINESFDEVMLAWVSDKSTLVPNAIFADSNAHDIFKLCFGANKEEHDVDYNRISELSVINVYQVPNWIKSFFVLKFPRIVIQHSGSHTVRKVLNSNAFKLKATAVVYQGNFHLSIVKHNNLEFYSFFDQQSVEDIIYHLTFALQQKELLNEKGTLELISGLGTDFDLLNKIQSGLEKISEYKQLKVESIENFTSKSQLLCV